MGDVLTIYVPSFFNMVGMSIVSPIIPIYADSFGVDFAVASLAITIFAFGRFVTDIPAGAMADRIGRRPMMLLGGILITVSALLNGITNNFALFLLYRFLEGVGSSMWITARQALLADILRQEERGRTLGYFQAVQLIGQSAGPTIGGWVAQYYGLNTPFFLYAGTGLITIALTFFLIFDVKGVERHRELLVSLSDVKRILKNLTFTMACFGAFTIFFQRSGIRTDILPLYASNVVGLEPAAIGTLISFSTITNVVFTIPFGYAIDLIGRKPVIMWCIFFTAVADIGFTFGNSFWTLAIAAVALGAATAGAAEAPLSLSTDASYGERRGLAMGVYRLVADLGLMLGPVLLGTTADFGGLRLPFYVMAAILIVNAGLILLFAKEIIDPPYSPGKILHRLRGNR
jgi:DHA1 family multidrug resistance protein-like MFS transporter